MLDDVDVDVDDLVYGPMDDYVPSINEKCDDAMPVS